MLIERSGRTASMMPLGRNPNNSVAMITIAFKRKLKMLETMSSR